MKREIIVTEDGSSSLFVNDWGETFHSKHGAVQESLHVYIKNGLEKISKNEIRILEFGFGTGLNAFLAYDYGIQHHKKIFYETIEAYPLNDQEIMSLNFDAYINSGIKINDFHSDIWGESYTIGEGFELLKHHSRFEQFNPINKCDIVFFDVFGFDYQPELWDLTILEKAHKALNIDGIFVTYACKGVVNRMLKELGFLVTKVEGPPGKRHMTVAVKKM